MVELQLPYQERCMTLLLKKANKDSMMKLESNMDMQQKVKCYILEMAPMTLKKDQRLVENIKLEHMWIKLHLKSDQHSQKWICKDLMKQCQKRDLKLEPAHKFQELDQFNKVKNQRPKKKWEFTKLLINLKIIKLTKSVVSLIKPLMRMKMEIRQNTKIESESFLKKTKWLQYLNLKQHLLKWVKWVEKPIFHNFKNSLILKKKRDTNLKENSMI